MKKAFSAPEIESDTIQTLSDKLLQMTEQLAKTNRELQRYQKERSEMLANISHDLRAPITAIRGALDLQKSHPDASREELWEALSLIDRRTAVLENLIQDMYLLFTVENPSFEIKCQPVLLAPFLEEYFFDAEQNPLYEGHRLILSVNSQLNALVLIDVSKMLRVLDNLFTNAAKYSGEGTTITLHAEPLAKKHLVAIEVSDNGIGIAPESLPHIFDRTYTVSRARTPGRETGSGLGLCIVRTIIERFGGSVECISSPGNGCTFRILLPLAEE